jgi:hypothetical protein
LQYIILGVTVLIMALNVLVGLRRGFSRGLLRLITLLISAVAAFVCAKSLAASVAQSVVPALEQAVASDPDFAAFLQNNPVIGQSAGALTQMLVAPLLFLLLYIVFKIITLVVFWILCVFVKKTKFFAFRWVWGAAFGALAGLIGVLVFVTPVMGYTQLFGNTITEAESLNTAMAEMELDEYNEKYITPASAAPVASQIYNGIGSKVFSGLTTVKWNESEIELAKEWDAVIEVVDNAAAFSKRPVAEYGTAESEAAHAMAKGVEESQLLSSLAGGALNGISNAWLSGEAFMGIEKPQTGDESVDIILNGLLRVFSTTSPELVGEDLENFADIFDLFIKYQIFSKIGAEGGTDQLVTHLSTSGFLAEARAMLASSERMKPVVDAISDAGMRLLIRELGDPAKYLEEHKELLDNMSNVLKDAVNEEGQIDKAAVSDGLQSVLAEKQVEVPAEAVDIIAEGLADEFTADELNTLTVDELTDRLISRFGNVENLDAVLAAQPAA